MASPTSRTPTKASKSSCSLIRRSSRSDHRRDLFFCHQGEGFQLAIELQIPHERRQKLPEDHQYHFVRYEVSIGINEELEETHILDEQVILQKELSEKGERPERLLFPVPMVPPDTIMNPRSVGAGKRRAIRKVYSGNDNFLLRNPGGERERGMGAVHSAGTEEICARELAGR